MQQKFVNAKQKLRLRNRIYIYNYLKDHKCSICWEGRVACLEFHHRDPKDKSFEPGMKQWRDMSMKRLQDEMAKCDVVCSNCHNVITAEQQWWYSFMNDNNIYEPTTISN